MLRLLLAILLSLFLVHCSEDPEVEEDLPLEQTVQAGTTDPDRILDEIPQHIPSVENLTVFPGDSEPLYSMELVPEQTYGELGEPYLSWILDCVEDDKGRVIIHNSNAGTNYEQFLHVFNADGTYHTQMGGQGRGPGEYLHMVGVMATGEKIVVLDATNKRVNEYSTEDYSIERTLLFENWKSDDGLRFGYAEPRNDGNYLLVFSEDRSKVGRLHITFQVMDPEGNNMNVESLVFRDGFRVNGGESIQPTMPVSFLGKTITALSHDDALYTVWSRDFLIRKYDAEGEYQSAIYYPVQGPPFDLEEYSNSQMFSPEAGDIEDTFASMGEEFPETLPVIERLRVDDENRMWVAVPVEDEKYEWWILKESGELLAKILLPRDKPIYDIKNGHLYSKQTNEETESEYAVKYRIELSEREEAVEEITDSR